MEILPSIRNPCFYSGGESREGRKDAKMLHPACCGVQKEKFHSGNAEVAILRECWGKERSRAVVVLA